MMKRGVGVTKLYEVSDDKFLDLFLGRPLALISLNICQELFYIRDLIHSIVVDRVTGCRELTIVVPVAKSEWSNSQNF